jgi:small-conductance mechanosensitive channel/CRP-like cAMP-binding protein
LSFAAHPLFLAATAIVAGFLIIRLRQWRSALARFLAQLLGFVIATGLLLSGGVFPYQPGVIAGSETWRIFVGALEILWWFGAAWLATGFLRAFVVLGGKRESKLAQDLLAALIYLTAFFSIVSHVLDLPVKGLLATSGAFAIIIGLALQSSLADVFSGIVLNIERPYHVGDWIIVDDNLQGQIVETNWRATHILTGNQDIAIIPNSVIAKTKLVNCSRPNRVHGASLRIKLEPLTTPVAACALLKEALLSSPHVLRTPEPGVTIKDISAESMDFELGYTVGDVGKVDQAQNELFERVYRTVSAAGLKFAPRLSSITRGVDAASGQLTTTERLLAGISLFSTLTRNEIASLASQMQLKEYKPGMLVARHGTILQALCIVGFGVLRGTVEDNGDKVEILRLAPGDYFGELGLLTGASLDGELTSLTKVGVYEISKEALAPLLRARPHLAEELSESLADRQLARQTVLDGRHHEEQHQEGRAERIATTIKRLFSLR